LRPETEAADLALLRPDCLRSPEHDSVAPAVAGQHQRPGALHEGVEGYPVGPACRAQQAQAIRRDDLQLLLKPAAMAGRGIVPGGIAIKTGHPFAPIGLGRGTVAGMPPFDIVRERNRGGENRRSTLAHRLIDREQLSKHLGQRPAVAGEMMARPDEHMALPPETQQGQSHERRALKIESARQILGQESGELFLLDSWPRKPKKINDIDAGGNIAQHDLQWLGLQLPVKGRSQYGMAGDERLPGVAHAYNIETSIQGRAPLAQIDSFCFVLETSIEDAKLDRR
jgi:hypothetical protein